ncbi:sigma-70 family RNA polymerase sigma factor [Microtetraspora malaysiensis]|uniref:sigma-70 family RNA polymerase sigma factor n=1 Tax=Microtetraspora malaysiensis TaxID=161358 RepID=UPI003D92EB00
MSIDLIERARSGDEAAFEQLVGRYRGEVQIHCYRFLGSLADAEDALQETFAAAWRGLAGFEGRASFRTWLYRIATNHCLNLLRTASRRPAAELPVLDVEAPEPTRRGEVVWLEPYPDVLLAGLTDTAAGPEARYETREAVSLAFVTALQLLPPRQRAALILCEVLDFPARQVAEMLDTTDQSVASALKRARATLAREVPKPDQPAPAANSPAEQELLSRLVQAFEDSDVQAIVALMTDDVWVRMPPVPLEYQGRELATRFFDTIAFRHGRRYRLVPTRANGQPAFGVYLRDPLTQVAHAFGLFVITLAGERVSVITRFDSGVFARFGLSRTLAG